MKKSEIKDILGYLPFSAELGWRLRQRGNPPVGGYALDRLKKSIPNWLSDADAVVPKVENPKKILVFTMLRYWLEQSSMMSLALSALGHKVTLVFLPYAHWKKPVNRLDLKLQDIYIRDALNPLRSYLDIVSALEIPKTLSIPPELSEYLPHAAYRDVQYSLLREDVDENSDLFQLRMDRNQEHALAMLSWMEQHRPDGVIVPNGSMLEFGITFKIAEHLAIPVVSYEFGEQAERMWMAQNDDVMRQDTSSFWESRKDHPLTSDEWVRVKEFFSSRQGGGLWENFSRRWQGTPILGSKKVRSDLNLDSRPVVLLPANVLGDSLTLGRHIFSNSMTEWMTRTIEFFCKRPDIQFVIRIHPGEQLGWGPSVYDILTEIFPQLPENIHLLPADAKVNTYDLVNTADFGLVFTTTVGMEMAMVGLPVIVTGQTHYRNKGFTLDVDSWESYYHTLNQVLDSPLDFRLSREQVDTAWTYAYRFFFEYPQPFPWHVQHFWEDEAKWSLCKVMSPDGLVQFGSTFQYLIGEPMW